MRGTRSRDPCPSRGSARCARATTCHRLLAAGRPGPGRRRRARRHAEGRVEGRGPARPDRPQRPRQQGPHRRGRVGAGAAPAGRPRHQRDAARLRVRQRRGRPVERRGRLGGAAARGPRPLGPPAPRRAARAGWTCTSPSSISDTFGRVWRRGLTDVAIGCAGIRAVVDLRGTADALGRELAVTEVCVVDELASAAELVMGKSSGICAAVVRGVDPAWLGRGEVRAEVVRPAARGPVPLARRRVQACARLPLERPGRCPRRAASTAASRAGWRPGRRRAPSAAARPGGPRPSGPGGRRRRRSAIAAYRSLIDVSTPVPTLITQAVAPLGGPHERVDAVVDVQEVAGLLAVAVDRAPLAGQQPRRERGDHAAVVAVGQSRAVARWRGPYTLARASAVYSRSWSWRYSRRYSSTTRADTPWGDRAPARATPSPAGCGAAPRRRPCRRWGRPPPCGRRPAARPRAR